MAVTTKTALTNNLDRWDLIADRELGVAELGWAIAAANPDLIEYLVLPAGITLNIPDLATLRRPLTAANPAREDDGEFLPLPADDTPAPISTGGGVSGDFVPLSAVGVTVAPLFNNLVPVGYLPAYPTLVSLGGLAADRVGVTVAPLVEGLVPAGNLPAYPTLVSLGAASVSDVNAALALKLDAAARNAAGGVAGLNAQSLININQLPLGSLFQFTASATFRGGTVPGVAVSLTQAGVNADGLPIYWLVNAAATAGNRLKSITISNNGNIRFTHHADDGTAGNVLEHTASGNILTNGTVRPGAGATAFTGASFVAGATYFRTDIGSGAGTGALTFSDGFEWLATMSRYLTHTSTSPDGYSPGLRTSDINIDGALKGWHVLTSIRPNNANFGVQIAMCDTQSAPLLVKFRAKVNGVWSAWGNIAVS